MCGRWYEFPTPLPLSRSPRILQLLPTICHLVPLTFCFLLILSCSGRLRFWRTGIWPISAEVVICALEKINLVIE